MIILSGSRAKVAILTIFWLGVLLLNTSRISSFTLTGWKTFIGRRIDAKKNEVVVKDHSLFMGKEIGGGSTNEGEEKTLPHSLVKKSSWSTTTTSSKSENNRRVFLLACSGGFTGTVMGGLSNDNNKEVLAATSIFEILKNRQTSSSLYLITPRKNSTDSLVREPLKEIPDEISSEVCLLKLLPVKNQFFRSLEKSVTGLNALRSKSVSDLDDWESASESMNKTLTELDMKRSMLNPVFNMDDGTLLQIMKGERGEQLIESFRERLVGLIESTDVRNATKTFQLQKKALLTLSEIGELLVAKFPYNVPDEGKFSYLPRLLGRAKVTFSFRRRSQILGNVTIVADGYTAPITAGNFVDLSIRNFYTGLPIKVARKKLGTSAGANFEVASIPVFGSFQEGFYDPLTAKPRRIPLEIIRLQQGSPKLSYAEDIKSIVGGSSGPAYLEATDGSRPLLSFKIPGLIALNHPDNNVNDGSSEFIGLQKNSMMDDKRGLLDGEYAPFGYIIAGNDLFESLQPGDIIDSTQVDEWGLNYLKKIRTSSFSEVVASPQASNNEESKASNGSAVND